MKPSNPSRRVRLSLLHLDFLSIFRKEVRKDSLAHSDYSDVRMLSQSISKPNPPHLSLSTPPTISTISTKAVTNRKIERGVRIGLLNENNSNQEMQLAPLRSETHRPEPQKPQP